MPEMSKPPAPAIVLVLRSVQAPPPPAEAHLTPSVWVESAVSTWPFDPTASLEKLFALGAAIRSPFVVATFFRTACRDFHTLEPASQYRTSSSAGDGAVTSPMSSRCATVPPETVDQWVS